MLLIQTAFDQEFAAVMAAGPVVPGHADPTIHVSDRQCRLLMTGIGLAAARKQLVAQLDRAELDRVELPELVISLGLCGGLSERFQAGQAFLIDRVHSVQQPEVFQADLGCLASNLLEQFGVQSLVSLARPALTAPAKRELAERFGVGLCDMETHAVAEVCRQRQIPWIGVRVVSDRADENIPAWVLTLPRLIEQKKWLRLLGRLATHPQDLPRLIGLGRRLTRLRPILTQLTQDLVTNVLPARK